MMKPVSAPDNPGEGGGEAKLHQKLLWRPGRLTHHGSQQQRWERGSLSLAADRYDDDELCTTPHTAVEGTGLTLVETS